MPHECCECVERLRAEVFDAQARYDALWNSDACEDVRLATARAEQAETRLEEAQNVGAELMLAQMVKAVESGGRFSDPRANDFVDAKARLREVVEAGGRLRRHVELLLPRDLGGAAREQVIEDLRHWIAAAQPEEEK